MNIECYKHHCHTISLGSHYYSLEAKKNKNLPQKFIHTVNVEKVYIVVGNKKVQNNNKKKERILYNVSYCYNRNSSYYNN
jgi:hypothetical protein